MATHLEESIALLILHVGFSQKEVEGLHGVARQEAHQRRMEGAPGLHHQGLLLLQHQGHQWLNEVGPRRGDLRVRHHDLRQLKHGLC